MARKRRSKIADFSRALSLILFVAFIVVALSKVSEQNLKGRFVAVDGDSLVQNDTRIRLIGIDAPELNQTCDDNGKPWPCGRMSRNQLRRWIAQQEVVCNGSSLDQYDRLLATCSVKGENLNEKLVLNGWALSYGDYQKAEAIARKNKAGIWIGDFVPPKQWRREKLEQRSSIWSWVGM